MLITFFYNMTIIISVTFVLNRIKEYLIKESKGNDESFKQVIFIGAGLLSILVMLNPFEYKEMIFDLRNVPIFLISYIFGWEYGFASALFPSLYRFYLGGEAVLQGILIPLFLPVIFGAVFSNIKRENSVLTKLNFKRILLVYLGFTLIKTILQFLTLGIPVNLLIGLIFCIIPFSIISLLGMALIINDTNEKIQYYQELERRAKYDGMTGLLCRESVLENIKMIIDKDIPNTLVMLDIDWFKKYNDYHGHPAGDEVIKKIADILRNNLRDQDLIGRYGGEEFILVLPGIDEQAKAHNILNRIKNKVEECGFKGEETQPEGKITVSLGARIYSKYSSIKLAELIQQADEALYMSKNEGRNKIIFYN